MTASKYEMNNSGSSGGDSTTVETASTSVDSTASSTQSTVGNDLGAAPIMFQPNSPSSSSSTSKNNGDSTFEPTVDMMVNDFDDEQTLEEEEALAAQEAEDPSAELSSLQKESDMPLEELLALYNCSGSDVATSATGGSSGSSALPPTAHHYKKAASTASGHQSNIATSGTGGLAIDSITHNSSSSTHRSNKLTQSGHTTSVESKLKRSISATSKKDETSRENGGAATTHHDVEADDYDDEDDIKETSQLRELYPETYGSSDKRLLRTISRQQSDDEEDGEYSPDEDEFKKTIMVGSEFQAVIPEGFFKYDDVLPYENEDKLIWDPSRISERDTEEYLLNSLHAKQRQQQQQQQQNGNSHILASGIDSLPVGNHLRDDEQALYLLLQCGHNVEEALRRKRINAVPSSEQMSSWSEDECRNFESGIRIYGKDFHTIQHTKVRTRSVGELVQFYYLWKKTERHDIFANKARLDKKKYNLHPGLTDYMDRFLEEQEGGSNGSNTAAAMLTTTATSMTLRDRSLSPSLQHSVTLAAAAAATRSDLASSDHRHRLGGAAIEAQSIPKDPLSIDDIDDDDNNDEDDDDDEEDDDIMESSRTPSKFNVNTTSSSTSSATIESLSVTTSATAAIISTAASNSCPSRTTSTGGAPIVASDSSTMQRTVNQ